MTAPPGRPAGTEQACTAPRGFSLRAMTTLRNWPCGVPVTTELRDIIVVSLLAHGFKALFSSQRYG